MSYELPFILWGNEMENGIITVTSETSGFPKENMIDWLDWTYWKSTAGGTIDIILNTGVGGAEIDTIAILAHNMGTGANSLGCDVDIREASDQAFTIPSPSLGSYSPITDDPFYIKLSQAISEQYVRIRIENMDDPVYIGICWMGSRMTLPVGPEFSFDPDLQEIKSEKFVSYTGRMVSSAVQYVERSMNVEFKRIPQSFIASDLLSFLEDHYGQMIPFFFVPDPGDVFGDDKIYYIVAPDNPRIELPVYNDDISYRNWTLVAQGIRQSTFR